MRCLECGSQAVTERPERTAQGYRRFRCRACGKPFNERSVGVLNRTQYPSDGTVNLMGCGRNDARNEAGDTDGYAVAATPVTAAQV